MITVGQDEAIFCSTQLNESCWTIDNESTLRSKGLRGSAAKKPLKESPFVIYLDYGARKDGYWMYSHMVLQIEDCIYCVQLILP